MCLVLHGIQSCPKSCCPEIQQMVRVAGWSGGWVLWKILVNLTGASSASIAELEEIKVLEWSLKSGPACTACC